MEKFSLQIELICKVARASRPGLERFAMVTLPQHNGQFARGFHEVLFF